MVRWIGIEEIKKRMFQINKDNIYSYSLRPEGKPVLKYGECFFINLVTDPKRKSGKFHLNCTVCEFDHEQLKWVEDEEILRIIIVERDYKRLKLIAATSDCRIKCKQFYFNNPFAKVRNDLGWELIKKGD